MARLGGPLAAALLVALGLFILRPAPARSQPDASAGQARLEIQPSHIDLTGPRGEHGLLVTLIAPDGRRSDVTQKSRFSSKATQTVTVAADGQCQAVSDGQAEIVAEHEGLTAAIPVTVTGAGSAAPVPSFRQDVIPVLTRFSCNAGGCHGKLSGQNGFKLSLRGYAPEQDFEQLTTDLTARRIDFAEADASLLLQKPVGTVPHEGGKRFNPDSKPYRLLADWVAARAPGPVVDESDATSLEVLPGDRLLRPGDTQQLLARAHYPDGRVRDVTWLTQFFSNDEATVRVSEGGLVKVLRYGETSVRAHFQGQVAVVNFTAPYENAVEPSQFAAKNNRIDEHVFRKLQDLRIPPSLNCDDATFARRAFLDAIGTLPTPQEVSAFVADARPDKRAKLVDELLARPEYADYWTLQLADLLQNRRERDHDVRGVKNVRAFHGWLRERVAANRPWDAIAREVLTSTGDSVRQPQIGYYVYTIGEKSNVAESDVTDSVAQAFLGVRIGCAKCHNHPLEKYTQDDYYHFAAFFSRVSLKRTEAEKGATELLVVSREEREQQREMGRLEKSLAEAEAAATGKTGDEAKAAEKKVAELKKRVEEIRKRITEIAAKPATVNQPRTNKPMAAQPLDRSKLDNGPDPRTALAAWMTDPKNEQFSGAMVNRLWRHFMGIGLVEPVDDLRSSNPPSNRAVWQALNEEFVASKYDLKHVMRLILNSRAYQLSSETLPENELDRKFHSHYYARRLPAEVLSDAVSAATGVPDTFKGAPVGVRAIQLPEPGVDSYFLTIFGRSDRVTACACERNGEVTLPQVLHFQGGDDLQRKIRSDQGKLAALLKAEPDNTKVTEQLFLTTFGRKPRAQELAAVNEALAAGDDRGEVFRDLFWALLNAKEFGFNH